MKKWNIVGILAIIQAIGEPDWSFGSASGRLILFENKIDVYFKFPQVMM